MSLAIEEEFDNPLKSALKNDNKAITTEENFDRLLKSSLKNDSRVGHDSQKNSLYDMQYHVLLC
jgi:hypothetical protein